MPARRAAWIKAARVNNGTNVLATRTMLRGSADVGCADREIERRVAVAR